MRRRATLFKLKRESACEAFKAFLQSAVTIGQTDPNKVGHIPLPPDFQSKAAAAVNSIG